MNLKDHIRTVPNWPKEGVMFSDITTLLENPHVFSYVIHRFVEKYRGIGISKVAGIESRGFIFGAPVAKELGVPFILIRKKGKLPSSTVGQDYELEYGTDTIEIHTDTVKDGENILIVDDLLATGGTLQAACKLVEKVGGVVTGAAVVINLPDLNGMEKLNGYDVFHLVEYEGE